MKTNVTSFKVLACMMFLVMSGHVFAQLPKPVLVGYWHNWDMAAAPYIELDQVDSRYNVVNVAFGIPINGTDYQIGFTPSEVSEPTFISQLQTLQNQGRKVLLSIGGASDPVKLDNVSERDIFVSSVNDLIDNFGFDGIDIDFEGSSLTVSGGTIANPVDAPVINLINGIKTIMHNYHVDHNKKLLLTFAPETAFVQGGQSAWGSIWGAYLPVIHALRDSLDLLHVQLYNSGSMYGIDGNIYSQGTADFIVAMTEAVIQGFNVDRWNNQAGPFVGLPEGKIAVGLPACPNAAGGGFTNTATVAAALKYLLGSGPKPGSYTLYKSGGYPNLGGMMTWSVNWDNVSTCNNSPGEFADNFESIFLNSLPVELLSFNAKLRNDRVLLEWLTASEINNEYFAIERSADAINWEVLDYVPGEQNSQTIKTYVYTDQNPLLNQSYYRLQQKDKNGKITYSAVVRVENAKQGSYYVYPNPAKDHIIINHDSLSDNSDIFIYNNIGQLILQSKIGNQEELDISDFHPGMYYLVMMDSNNNLSNHKIAFVKAE